MFCKQCGKEIQEGHRFCLSCGAPVEGTGAEYPPQTEGKAAQSVAPARKKIPKQKKILFSVLGAVAVVVLIVLSVTITNFTKTRDLRNAIASRNGATVNAVYAQARSNKSTLKKYDALIEKTISEMVSELNAYDFTDAAEKNGADAVEQYMETTWGTLWTQSSKSDISDSISLDNQIHWQELGELIESKENYCEGLYCYKTEKDYDEAIALFAEVSDADPQHDAAVTMISECTDLYVQSILKKADEYFAEGDVSGCVSLLREAQSDLKELGQQSAEIDEKINAVLVKYAESYIAKAEEAFRAGDVTTAVGCAEAAATLNPNGGYDAKVTEYQLYLPYALYDIDHVLNRQTDEDFWGGIGFDVNSVSNNDVKMENAMTWYQNNDNESAAANVYYNLEGRYDILTGTLFLPKESRDTNLAGYFEVYGDGKLLYTSPKISAGVLPQDFQVDISGVQKLRIAFHGNGTGGFLGRGPDYGVNNLIVQKNLPQQ